MAVHGCSALFLWDRNWSSGPLASLAVSSPSDPSALPHSCHPGPHGGAVNCANHWAIFLAPWFACVCSFYLKDHFLYMYTCDCSCVNAGTYVPRCADGGRILCWFCFVVCSFLSLKLLGTLLPACPHDCGSYRVLEDVTVSSFVWVLGIWTQVLTFV